MVNESIAKEILEQVACQHPGCGRPLTECDGRSHMAQSARHLTLCPLCGGAAHNNDSKAVMAFRCAMRQALAEYGERFDDKSDVLQADQVRKLADWLDTPGRQYGKEAAAKMLVAAGTTGIAAAKLGKRATVAAATVVAPAPPVVAAPPPVAPPTPIVAAPKPTAPEPEPATPIPPRPSLVVGAPTTDDDDMELDAAELERLTKRLERVNS